MWLTLSVRLILSAVLACFYPFLVIISSQLLAFICRIGFAFLPATGFPFPWFISVTFHRFSLPIANHIIHVISVYIGVQPSVRSSADNFTLHCPQYVTIRSPSSRISYVLLIMAGLSIIFPKHYVSVSPLVCFSNS